MSVARIVDWKAERSPLKTPQRVWVCARRAHVFSLPHDTCQRCLSQGVRGVPLSEFMEVGK